METTVASAVFAGRHVKGQLLMTSLMVASRIKVRTQSTLAEGTDPYSSIRQMPFSKEQLLIWEFVMGIGYPLRRTIRS
jgi:hypothetical protein